MLELPTPPTPPTPPRPSGRAAPAQAAPAGPPRRARHPTGSQVAFPTSHRFVPAQREGPWIWLRGFGAERDTGGLRALGVLKSVPGV